MNELCIDVQVQLLRCKQTRSSERGPHLCGREDARLSVVVALPGQLARGAVAQPRVHVRHGLGGVDLEEAVQHLQRQVG